MQPTVIQVFVVFLFIALSVKPGVCEDSLVAPGHVSGASSGDRIVLTGAQIKEMNVQSIPELLNRLPGISAGETYAKIQGVSDVRALLDGRPMNDPSSAHGGIKWNMVSIHDVEKIEILMGGGAAAVGDGTSGGAILITTRKQDEAHGHIDLSAGNFGTENLLVRFGQNIRAVSIGGSGIYDHTDGNRINNDKTKKQATARLELKSDSLCTGFSLGYSSDERGYPGKPQWPTPLARASSECFSGAWSGKIRTFTSNIFFSKDSKKLMIRNNRLLRITTDGRQAPKPPGYYH